MVATVTDEQFAARELVRDWARKLELERSHPQRRAGGGRRLAAGIQRPGRAGTVRRGRFRRARWGRWQHRGPVRHGRGGGQSAGTRASRDHCAGHSGSRRSRGVAALAAGERFAGVALEGNVQFDPRLRERRAPSPWVLGGADGGVLLLPSGGKWLLVDTGSDGVLVEPLRATDFSRPLARVVLTSAPAAVVAVSSERVENWPRPCWRPRRPA